MAVAEGGCPTSSTRFPGRRELRPFDGRTATRGPKRPRGGHASLAPSRLTAALQLARADSPGPSRGGSGAHSTSELNVFVFVNTTTHTHSAPAETRPPRWPSARRCGRRARAAAAAHYRNGGKYLPPRATLEAHSRPRDVGARALYVAYHGAGVELLLFTGQPGPVWG